MHALLPSDDTAGEPAAALQHCPTTTVNTVIAQEGNNRKLTKSGKQPYYITAVLALKARWP
jgi:hypothetical protein